MTTTEIQNTERVTKIFEAFGRGDVAYILDQLADDARFVSHLDPIVPWAGEFSGKDNVARFFQALGRSVDVVLFVRAVDSGTCSPADEKESRGYLQNPLRNVIRGHTELFRVHAGLISHRVNCL